MHTLIRLAVSRVLPAIAIGWLLLALLNTKAASWLVLEDGLFEWLQFFLLIGAAVYCYRAARTHRGRHASKSIRSVFLLLFVLWGVWAMEEISWGQRIIGFATPEVLVDANSQDETTLHNLRYVQRVRHWIILAVGVSGITLIRLQMNSTRNTLGKTLAFFSAPPYFAWTFCLIIVSSILIEGGYIIRSLWPDEYAPQALYYWSDRFGEIAELGVALVAFSHAFLKHQELASGG